MVGGGLTTIRGVGGEEEEEKRKRRRKEKIEEEEEEEGERVRRSEVLCWPGGASRVVTML